MIQYFSKIEEDHLLYDLICKYHRDTLSDNHQTCRDLFGRTLGHVHHLFPGDLKSFRERLGHIINLDLNEIIQQLTVLPTYSSFLTEQEYQFFTDAMITFKNRVALSRLFSTKKYHLKFCPSCNDENRVESREIYWRRSHQIPSIPICSKHNCFLYSWSPLKNSYKQKIRFYCASDVLKKKYVERHNTDVNLSNDVSKLIYLSKDLQYNSINQEAIIASAIRTGFYKVTPSQKVLNYSQFQLFLKYIKVFRTHEQISERTIESWLKVLLKGTRNKNLKPLLTLQLVSFLDNQNSLLFKK